MNKKIFKKAALIFSLSILQLSTALTQQWTPVPFIKQETRDAGISLGGEEAQWPQTIVFEPINGSYVLYGTDVGGLFRSTDEGETWEPSNIGYAPRGVAFFAIDPNNVDRVIAVGGMKYGNSNNGASLSKDGGISWESTHRMFNQDYKHYKDACVYDATSFDTELGYSTVAYWSCPPSAEPTGPVLFKSTDGGQSWFVVNSDPTYGNKHVKVSPSTGSVFIFGDGNLYRSTDGGETFEEIVHGFVYGLEFIYTQPDTLFLMKSSGIYQSVDDGESFVKTGSAYITDNPQRLRVSPVNPDHMMHWRKEGDWSFPRYYTTDGGDTWYEVEIVRGDKYFFNWRQPRQGAYSYHPKKENVIISVGQDNVTKSTDNGATFHWSNSGVNNFCPSGIHPLNPFNHKLLYIGGRDKAGAYSKDGGYTWINAKAIELSYSGGHAASGCALTEDILVGVGHDRDVDDKWKICVSTDGGHNFRNTGIEFAGIRTACPDITDPAKVYLGAFRSYDYGETWVRMAGVEGVFTYNPSGENELYGAIGDLVVRSFDHGKTWQSVVDVGTEIEDVAIDHENEKLYIAAGNDLFTCSTEGENLANITTETPADQFGNRYINSVAVDPNHPEVVYITNQTSYLMDNNVVRSTDHGQSWEILTRNTRFPNPQFGKDGGRMPGYVRVCPTTSEAYIGGGCFGLWKIGPPPETDPVVKLTVPVNLNSMIVDDTASITLDVFNDNNRVEKLELIINDNTVEEFSAGQGEYNWIPSGAGDYHIYAQATDTAGQKINSLPVLVTVLPSEIPVISIISPDPGSEYDYLSDIEISAEANDPDGQITKVEFYVDSTLVGEVMEEPYSIHWEDVTEGDYNIMVSATDNSGQTVFSPPLSLHVNEQIYSFYYTEDFNDGLAQDWSLLQENWIVESEQLHQTNPGEEEYCVFSGYSFKGYSFSVKANPESSNIYGVIFNYQDENNYYLLMLDAYPSMVFLIKVVNGEQTTLHNSTYSGGGAGNWVDISILNDSTSTTVLINNNTILNQVSTSDYSSGLIGLYSRNTSVWFEDVNIATKVATSTVGIRNYQKPNYEIDIFPNPVNGKTFTVQIPWKASPSSIKIYDIRGKEIFSGMLNGSSINLDAKIFGNPGLYIVKVVCGGDIGFGKVVVGGGGWRM